MKTTNPSTLDTVIAREAAPRRIDLTGIAPVENAASGRPPKLEWLALASLVVDPRYQRAITAAGRANIRRIAAHFNWAAFSTVIVTRDGPDRFAVIDGQHRCHAAALIGLERVPCQIVDAGAAETARAFGEINCNVTRVHALTAHHALVAAGDPRALEIAAIAAEAGVVIARSPQSQREIPPGVTLLTRDLARFAHAHGRDNVVLALRAIVTGSSPTPGRERNRGLLSHPLVGGAAMAFAARRRPGPSVWPADRLIQAFHAFDLAIVRTDGERQGARVITAARDIGARLNSWAVRNGFAHQAVADGSRRRSVSLARVPSLERPFQ